MATFVADAQGVVRAPFVLDDGTRGSVGLRGQDGALFAPGAAVEVDDARLAELIATLTAPLRTGVSIGVARPGADAA